MKKTEPKPQDALAILQSLYGKFPVFPYLDRATSALLIFCVAAYFIFIAFVFFASPVQIAQQVHEDPIYKNTQLQLVPGERYAYQLSSPDGQNLVSYTIGKSASCQGTVVVEDSSGTTLCLSKSGNLMQPGFESLNSSFLNQSILLFSPWMLAASDTFSWKFDNTVSAAGTQVSFPVALRSQGRKTVAGREAFEIGVTSMGEASTFYIDAEKRVLLSIDAANVSVKLVSAPFALNWTGN